MNYSYQNVPKQKTLAWHETLELHELVAFSSIGLMKLKKGLNKISCPTLKSIYSQSIRELETNIRELLQFYPLAARGEEDSRDMDKAFYAGDLLAFSKAAVRNYAVAITETATPELRSVLAKQLQSAINIHARIFYYMYERGFYPAYNLQKLLNNDINLAKKALSM
ncbi:spore coat protein [Metabacillus litoralis]|uniref:spore coat protein n=1 Tax=Metabacillus TaxID=2675233 RepID=UPI000EF5980A|nr:spore coat protein [Metabacillus litoralis]MCM3160309.1 spore coat protein [Metabacillus litoralis]MCM3408894.1 spore coat protein [Metabacillus litoralis]UHA59460.1 spore coat protein [Metabacillus litoralis]